MAVFTCERYPELQIGHLVRFTGGVCETDDPATLDQLRIFAADGEYGITETSPPQAAAPAGGRPRRKKGDG